MNKLKYALGIITFMLCACQQQQQKVYIPNQSGMLIDTL